MANEVIAVKTAPGLDGFDVEAAVRFQTLENGSTRVTLDFEHVVISTWRAALCVQDIHTYH